MEALLTLPSAAARTSVRARALFVAGSLAIEEVDLVTSRKLLDEAVEIYRELGERVGTVVTLTTLAILYRDMRDHAKARSMLLECVRLCEEAGDRISATRAMSNLADVARREGNFGAARALQQECLSFFREQGDRAGVAWSLNHLGDIAREEGKGEVARSLYEEALSVFRELGESVAVARCLIDLGHLALEQKKPVDARQSCGAALAIFSELGLTRDIPRTLEQIVCCADAEGRSRRALCLAGAADGLRRTFGTPRKTSSTPQLDSAVDAARGQLGNIEAARAWMEGRKMPIESAVQYALGDQD